jgi:transposase InsO family protein
LAYAEVLPDEKATTAIAFLRRACAFAATASGCSPITVRPTSRSLTRWPAARWASATCALAPRPQTNGKAERFIPTMLASWAYGAIYCNSADRAAALDGWLWNYNHQRRHSALGHKHPLARLTERTNLLAAYS